MSLKKLHLYRNKIEQAVREFVGDNTLQKEVLSPQKIKYSVSFADENVFPAIDECSSGDVEKILSKPS